MYAHHCLCAFFRNRLNGLMRITPTDCLPDCVPDLLLVVLTELVSDGHDALTTELTPHRSGLKTIPKKSKLYFVMLARSSVVLAVNYLRLFLIEA